VFVVDANVLLYAANHRSPVHEPCRKLLEKCQSQAGAWFLTWGICYEFLRVATHTRIFQSPWSAGEAWSFLETLLKSPGLTLLLPTERHATVAAEVLLQIPHLAGNIFHEAHTAVLMREHGVRRIYTRDTHFHRFPFLEPIDPTTSSL
jgi:toxin-antitoxin system PIN domain toxin